jgi:hypothetical protein
MRLCLTLTLGAALHRETYLQPKMSMMRRKTNELAHLHPPLTSTDYAFSTSPSTCIATLLATPSARPNRLAICFNVSHHVAD